MTTPTWAGRCGHLRREAWRSERRAVGDAVRLLASYLLSGHPVSFRLCGHDNRCPWIGGDGRRHDGDLGQFGGAGVFRFAVLRLGRRDRPEVVGHRIGGGDEGRWWRRGGGGAVVGPQRGVRKHGVDGCGRARSDLEVDESGGMEIAESSQPDDLIPADGVQH